MKQLMTAWRSLRDFFLPTRPIEANSILPKDDFSPTARAVIRKLEQTVDILAQKAAEAVENVDARYQDYMERVNELIEARQMAGAGPWQAGPATLKQTDSLIAYAKEAFNNGPGRLNLREDGVPISAGAYGDIDLALQNVEWRREVNMSWMEFSRWGIQQIILVSRLYYIKNPIIRRLVDVCASYVFARGVEISSPDKAVNDEIDAFIRANQKVLGQRALVNLEKRKDYDGNLFFVFFSDKNTGESSIRTIDATEIDEIATDPDDTDTPWYYHRVCAVKKFNPATGATDQDTVREWYPALGYDPTPRPVQIRDEPVRWENPVYHSKCGEVAKWTYGCPRAYPALDWAKEARKYLEASASVKQSNAQIARTITTKGGQQAIQGLKYQLQTTVGPSANIWDTNPTSVAGATMASGPGSEMKLVAMRNMSDSPDEVRRYFQMCVMVWGVPLTFLGDTMDGSMATAVSLDRPTETVMLEKQEAWIEDLTVLVLTHLKQAKNAPNGKLREALLATKMEPAKVVIRECSRVPSKDGSRMVYAPLEKREGVLYEADKPVAKDTLIVRVNFPSIREGDLKLLIESTVEAMTLGNRAGQVIGIDEKEGVRHLYDLLDFEDGDELVEKQYPKSEYEIDRTKEVLPAPIQRPGVGSPAGTIAANVQIDQPGIDKADAQKPAVKEALARVNRALARMGRNGHAEHISAR